MHAEEGWVYNSGVSAQVHSVQERLYSRNKLQGSRVCTYTLHICLITRTYVIGLFGKCSITLFLLNLFLIVYRCVHLVYSYACMCVRVCMHAFLCICTSK